MKTITLEITIDDPTIYVPSWEEEYELKKAIKIERELHSKALF